MPANPARHKKAPLTGAFFLLLVWLGGVSAADGCGPPAEAGLVKVRYTHDGDTLTLHDDTRVRLIGINTPELAGNGKAAQPLAIRARDQLRQLLFRHGNQVKLLYGKQRRDQHGRSLAYLWLPDGTNVVDELLRAGLGWLVAIPPDTRFIGCHREAEAEARRAIRGVWKEDALKARDSASLDLRSKGFELVRGRITRVNHGGGATWVNLEGRFAIRIPDEDLKNFTAPPSQEWIGRTLEVRGWIYQTRGELRVNVGHPANLQLY
jgi:endonuclease YncB( thermonuclease family)